MLQTNISEVTSIKKNTDMKRKLWAIRNFKELYVLLHSHKRFLYIYILVFFGKCFCDIVSKICNLRVSLLENDLDLVKKKQLYHKISYDLS